MICSDPRAGQDNSLGVPPSSGLSAQYALPRVSEHQWPTSVGNEGGQPEDQRTQNGGNTHTHTHPST